MVVNGIPGIVFHQAGDLRPSLESDGLSSGEGRLPGLQTTTVPSVGESNGCELIYHGVGGML